VTLSPVTQDSRLWTASISDSATLKEGENESVNVLAGRLNLHTVSSVVSRKHQKNVLVLGIDIWFY
jgi:hypothetical protein